MAEEINREAIKESNLQSNYEGFKLGTLYEKQNQEIKELKADIQNSKEKSEKDIEILKTSIIDELKASSQEQQLQPEQAEEEFTKTMSWLKENENSEQWKQYLEDPTNFICWYCYSRGLISNLKDWNILRQTSLKDINHWKDIYKIFEHRQSPLTSSKRSQLTEEFFSVV